MRVLDLFSGIGGFSLGLERAGMQTVAFCEIDPYCRAVLRKNWPHVPCFYDVRDFDGTFAEVITAGFPCQDISIAGRRAGLAGEQSGLWAEVRRLVRDTRPRFALLENSPSLCVRGLREIIGDLAAIGYDAEWFGLPAAAIGAPHLRAREWVLAYPTGFRNGCQKGPICTGRITSQCRDWWSSEPAVGRVADGIPRQVDRLRALGNAIVPQIAEMIGRAIMGAA